MSPVDGSGAALLDHVRGRERLKNDAALARAMGVTAPVVSKIRHGAMKVSPWFILQVHETFGITVADIRALAGVPRQRTTAGDTQ